MLAIRVICVGRLKEPHFLAAAREYEKRLSAYCRPEIIEVPEARLPDKPSDAEIAAALSREAGLISEKIPAGAVSCALCVEGGLMDSEAFSKKLEDFTVRGASKLAFIVGGSYGLDPRIKAEAGWRLSMSPMTFPHHLARVMLLEQVYRSMKIREGSAYHK